MPPSTPSKSPRPARAPRSPARRPRQAAAPAPARGRPRAAAKAGQRVDIREVISLIERAYLVWALVESRGNRTVAADRLRLPRATFIDRMRHHGLMSYLSARRARRLLAAELDR